MNKLFVTFFGSGLLKPAPGTWGSAAAIPAAYVLHVIGGPFLLIAASVAVYAFGIFAVAEYTKSSGNADPSEVVIDEVVGQWIALWPVSFGLYMAGAAATSFPYPGWITAFVLFRLFDIWKPGPVGWADRKHGATGVMLDDVIAGALAAVGVVALASLYHLVFA